MNLAFNDGMAYTPNAGAMPDMDTKPNYPHLSTQGSFAWRHIKESQAVNHPGYGQIPQTPLPLAQRVASDAYAYDCPPALRAPSAAFNFPCAPPSHSPFVPAPHQPSPTEQRKRAKSQVGPKPTTGPSRRPSVAFSFRSPTVSPDGPLSSCFPGTHPKATPRAYDIEDAQNALARTMSSVAIVSSNSKTRFQSTDPSGAAAGYSSIAQLSTSPYPDTRRPNVHPDYAAPGGQNAPSRTLSRAEDLFSNSQSNFESTYSSYHTTHGKTQEQTAWAGLGQSSAQVTNIMHSHESQRSKSQSNKTTGAQKAQATAGHEAPSSRYDSQRTQNSSRIEQSPMLRDIALIAAVAAANADHREFLWYGVWNIAIKDYMFSRCNTSTTACNLVPQYVLHREYDPSSSESTSKGKPRGWVIPDFALVLQHIRLSSTGRAVVKRQRVILIVENKPIRPKRMRQNVGNPFSVIYDQLHKQALFAFASHPTLNTVGFILTLGELWQYGEFSRPADNLLSSWSEAKDPSWTRSARKVVVK
ncbi:hypothetical protein K503DRAFT_804605, partial [Rhizopogon vinicolor AM-OR11-026]